MTTLIIKLKDKYLEWSTVVDAPTTYGMTLREFTKYYKRKYGTDELRNLPKRLERVEKNGTSSLLGETLEDVLRGNRAGEKESTLTKEEIYRKYC